jgi:putative hydrolase of the HAD superfamily
MTSDAASGWVFFDLGNTLVDESRSDRAYLRQLYDLLRGYGADLPKAQFHKTVEGMMALRVASTHRQLAETLFLRYAKRGSKEEFLKQLFSRWSAQSYTKLWSLHKDVMPTLKAVGKNHPCGIIANQTEWGRKFIEQRTRFKSYFRVVVLSGEVGVAKPDRQIFLLALRRAGAPAKGSTYVGDRVDFDIAPAKALGMTTVLVKREYISSRIEPLQEEEKADYEIGNLRGLEDIVDEGLFPESGDDAS